MGDKKHKVLIADDYEADRFFLKEAIRRHAPDLEVVGELEDGSDVIAYLTGRDGYADRVKHPLPDLLIMDVRMPRMSGLEVLDWLKIHPFPKMKVAMLADSSFMEFREKAASFGLQHFYPKVINAGELVEVVRKLQAELEDGTPDAHD